MSMSSLWFVDFDAGSLGSTKDLQVCWYEFDMQMANSEAGILPEEIQEKGFNHEELIRILSTRSKAQLKATFKFQPLQRYSWHIHYQGIGSSLIKIKKG